MSSNISASERALRWLPKFLGIFVLMVFALSPEAFAQAGASGGNQSASGLCEVAKWLKTILTAAAIIALLLLVINNFFVKSSVVGDIILYVIIGCVIAAAAVYVIGLTGLSPTCSV